MHLIFLRYVESVQGLSNKFNYRRLCVLSKKSRLCRSRACCAARKSIRELTIRQPIKNKNPEIAKDQENVEHHLRVQAAATFAYKTLWGNFVARLFCVKTFGIGVKLRLFISRNSCSDAVQIVNH